MPSPSHKSALTYRPEIDGLRALAVLAVVAFHADGIVSGGFVGVDVFFVISGFLITSLIVRALEQGTFSLLEFWERRVRRLFPALLVVVIACTIAGFALMVPEHFAEFGQSVVAQGLLISNVYFWRQSGYFETASEFQPLLHTWSLAVEEQFYLAFPFLLLLVFKRGRRLALITITLLSGASLILSGYAAHHDPPAAFFLPHYRIWELGLGAILALMPRTVRLPRVASETIGLVGLALILFPIFSYTANTPFPGWAALPPCAGTALIILSNAHRLNLTGRLLALPPAVFIGKISYSLYLWHWPALVFLNYTVVTGATALQTAMVLVASFVLAGLTWKYIETPFRTGQWLPGRWKFLATMAAACVLTIGVGGISSLKDGLPSRFPPGISGFTPEPHPLAELSGLSQLYENSTLPEVGTPSSENPRGTLLLWGDSHAIAMLPVLDDLGKEYGVTVYVATRPGVAPVPDTWSKRWAPDLANREGDPVIDFIHEQKIDHVLLIARWSIYLFGTEGEDMKYLLSDKQQESKSPADSQAVFLRHMRSRQLSWKENGIQSWAMKEVPSQFRPVPGVLAQATLRGQDPNELARPSDDVEALAERDHPWLSKAMLEDDGKLLDPLPWLRDENGDYPLIKDGQSYYTDSHHLSPYATLLLKPLLIPVFESAAGITPTSPGPSPEDPDPADQ